MRGVMTGRGTHLPDTIVDSHALFRIMETSDKWIRARTDLDDTILATMTPNTYFPGSAPCLQRTLGPPDSNFFNNIQHYGNTTAAPMPIALPEAVEQSRLRRGDLICFVALGQRSQLGCRAQL